MRTPAMATSRAGSAPVNASGDLVNDSPRTAVGMVVVVVAATAPCRVGASVLVVLPGGSVLVVVPGGSVLVVVAEGSVVVVVPAGSVLVVVAVGSVVVVVPAGLTIVVLV